MARQLSARAGEAFGAIEEAASLIQNIAADYQNYARRARNAAEVWRQRHNAERLVSLLTGRVSDSFEKSPPEPTVYCSLPLV
jgi:20S proteasome alpha/beta subunit